MRIRATILRAVLIPAATFACAWRAAVDLDVKSAYVWRGITRNDELVVQPSVTAAGVRSLRVDFWGSYDTGKYAEIAAGDAFSEFNAAIWFRLPADIIDVDVGVIKYWYMDRLDYAETREIFVRAGFDVVSVGVAADCYYDIEAIEDFYAGLTVSRAFELTEKLDLNLNGAAGYAGSDFAAGGREGWHDYLLSAGLSYRVDQRFTVAGTVAYTDSLDTDVLPRQNVDWFGGLQFSYTF